MKKSTIKDSKVLLINLNFQYVQSRRALTCFTKADDMVIRLIQLNL
jgi:hypothetical protein